MIKSEPYTKIYELEQQPISVEYSDFTENILVSLISDEDHAGKAVVLALDSGLVEANIPAAVDSVRNAAVWHPGNPMNEITLRYSDRYTLSILFFSFA